MKSLPVRRNLRTQRNADIWAMTTEFGGAKPPATTPLLSYGWYMREQIRDGLVLILYVPGFPVRRALWRASSKSEIIGERANDYGHNRV